jgi:hypothetical protein
VQQKGRGIALHTAQVADDNMHAHEITSSPTSANGAHAMNPAQYAQPQQLFGASMHAGGWPKLGWMQEESSDDLMSVDEEAEQQDA